MDSNTLDDILPACERTGITTTLQEKYFDRIHDPTWGTWVDIHVLPSSLRAAAFMRMEAKERQKMIPKLYEEHLLQLQLTLQNTTEYTLFVSKDANNVSYFTAFLTFPQARKIGSMAVARLMDYVSEDKMFQLLQRDREQRTSKLETTIDKSYAA